MDGASASAPAYNKGKGPGGGGGTGPAVPTFPVRAYGSVLPGGALQRGEGVTGASLISTGQYCVQLSPASFPNSDAKMAFGFSRNGSLAIDALLGHHSCPDGVLFQLSRNGLTYHNGAFTFMVL